VSAECQVCGGKSTLFLCNTHTSELRRMLQDAPWWIDRLAEAAVGQAKLSDGGRGSSAQRLKGDDEVLPKCTCGHPEHELRDQCGETIPGVVTVVELLAPDQICACREYVPRATQAKIRAQFLSAGRVNTRASRLLAQVQNSLTTIVRDLCEHRGIEIPDSIAVVPRTGVALCTRLAQWLTANVDALAGDEGAGVTFTEIYRFIGDDKRDGEIGKVINRPIPTRTLGKCPTWIEEKRMACGVELSCRQGDVEVYCRGCRRTHNPDRLQLLLMKDLERKKISFDKILKANRIQPEEYQVPERTLRWWRQEGKLKPRGYRRPDGREVPTLHSDEDVPLYLWDDVAKLRTEKPERKAKAG
jgi:predicted Fe-S protein YdhL (DUF1289 family)